MTFHWFWGTLILSGIGAAIWGFAAYYFHRKETFPYTARASWLVGTVKETSKINITSGGAGLVVGVLSDKLEAYNWFQSAMFGVLIVAIAGAILSYFMGAALDAKTSENGEQIDVDHVFWIILHGMIFGATIVSMICIFGAVLCLGIELGGQSQSGL